MKRRAKAIIKTQLHSVFRNAQRFGFDILPRHYYSEIPDLRVLAATEEWKREYSLIGLANADPDCQFTWLKEMLCRDSTVPARAIYDNACAENGEAGYGPVEAQVLHGFVRALQPRRVLQIGCGVSTAVILSAAAESQYEIRVTCVDPWPTAFLRSAASTRDIKLIEAKVQELESDIVCELTDGDLLFIDSTHTLGPAGEVTRLVLEFLPRVMPGVFVHFHDILFPYDYMPDILNGSLFFPHESALLHAFLAFNKDFEMLASLSLLHHKRATDMRSLVPGYDPAVHANGLLVKAGDFPSSVYIQRTQDAGQLRDGEQ